MTKQTTIVVIGSLRVKVSHGVLFQVPRNKSLLNDGDVFILDLGAEIYQWNGSNCNKDEKFKVCYFH